MAEHARAGLTPAEGRRFGLTVGAALGVLAAIGVWRGHQIVPLVLGGGGAALLLAGLIIPGRLGGVYRAWMGVARAISRVTTPLVMAIMYLLILTPAGWIMRALGRNPLRHPDVDGSFWIRRESGSRSDLERQF